VLREHPEMQAFAAEVPRVGRLLRPICSMVGMQVPEYLALPKRKRVRGLTPHLASPSRGRGIAYGVKGLAARGDLDSLRFPDLCREALDGWTGIAVCGG
jgi:hypothetical protein